MLVVELAVVFCKVNAGTVAFQLVATGFDIRISSQLTSSWAPEDEKRMHAKQNEFGTCSGYARNQDH